MLYGTLVLVSSDDLPDATYTVNLDGTATTNFLSSISQPATVLSADTDILVQFDGLSLREEFVGDTTDVEVRAKITELALKVECSFGSCWKTLLDNDCLILCLMAQQ